MSTCKLTLGERIADTLSKQKKTQTDFSKEIGMRTSTLNAIITGARENPGIQTLIPIARGLNTSIDYLLGMTDEPTTDINLKAISKEYGISSIALRNIKKVLSDYSICEPEYYEKGRKIALNTLLESDSLPQFLTRFYQYLNFYPHHNESTYVWCAGLETSSSEESGKDEEEDAYYEVDIQAYVDDFFDDPDKLVAESSFFEDLLLGYVKDSIASVKARSQTIYEKNLEELDILQTEFRKYIEDIKDSDRHINDPFVSNMMMTYRSRISDLKNKIRNYEDMFNNNRS